MNKPNPLVGKTLVALYIAEDKEALRFVLSDSEVIVRCDADCCSYTWVEHVELPALGLPAVVISVEDLDMPDLGDMPGRDCVRYYGCKIVTNHGEIVIDYRNDSNGYYGGNLSWPDDRHYGGVYGQNNSKENWQLIAPELG